MKVRCYLDGFNFYYNICRKYDVKWIDLESLFKHLLTHATETDISIESLIVYTATVFGKEKSIRQTNYFNALKEYSRNTQIVRGKMRRVEKNGYNHKYNEVLTIDAWEEKNTDVNIAAGIVDDSHTIAGKEFDVACLISNDSDLEAALRVKRRLKQRIIWISPISHNSKSKVLAKQVTKKDRIIGISKDLVLQHKLPNKIGKYSPPDFRGWR